MGQPAAADHARHVGVGERGVQGLLDLERGAGAHRVPGRCGQLAGGLDERGDHPLASCRKLPQLRAAQLPLGLAQLVAEREQLIDQVRLVADQQVHHPRAHGRPAQLPQCAGQVAVARLPGLPHPFVARGDELIGGQGIQLVGQLVDRGLGGTRHVPIFPAWARVVGAGANRARRAAAGVGGA
jgi:hypothetical protein